MPRKNRKRRQRKKKQQGLSLKGDKEVTKTGQPGKQSVIYRGIGIPAEFYTKLKYTDTVGLISVPYQEYLLRLNSLYDPIYATGGTQPMYMDEFSTLYSRYCVHACDVQVTFVQRTNSTEQAFIKCGIYPLGDTTTAANYLEAQERDNAIYATLGPNTGDQGIINMSMYGKIHRILGLPKDEKNDNSLSATIAQDPSLIAYAHVWAGTLDFTANVNVYATITMTFYCKFFDRVNVSRS